MGVLADKKMGEKELIIVALSIMAPAVLSIYFIESKSMIIWAVVLLLTRVGAAMLEVLTDSYFYKRIDGDDVELIDFYRTAHSFAYIVAAILSAFVLLFFSMKAVFILVFAVIVAGFYPAYHLMDNKSEAEL
jgi:MFS family permease